MSEIKKSIFLSFDVEKNTPQLYKITINWDRCDNQYPIYQ